MKKHNKKNALTTDQSNKGKYQRQSKGKNNNTLSKGLKVLGWIYNRTNQGLTCTAFESFNHNQDTMFTTRVSMLCSKYTLEIPRRQVKNHNTGAYNNEYWLSDNDIDKVIEILNKE